VSAGRAVPLLLLAAAAACVLVALRVLPEVGAPADLGRTAVIVNDTAATVVVSRCPAPCTTGSGPVTLAPGGDLRAGPPGAADWLIEDVRGRRVGCLAVTAAGGRRLVSEAGPCPG
jgi:hypothetical protein